MHLSGGGKSLNSPLSSFFSSLRGLLGFIFACLIVFGFLPQHPVGSDALQALCGAEGLGCHRVTHRGGNLASVHLPFSLPSSLSQGEAASAKWFPCLMRKGPKSLLICVVLFSSSGKLHGPVLMVTSSQGLQQGCCCLVSSF